MIGLSLLDEKSPRVLQPHKTLNMAHKTADFEQLIRKTIEEWKVPGLSIAVVEGDEIYAKVTHCINTTTIAHRALELWLRHTYRRQMHGKDSL